jgi:hypothetical protein
LPLFLIDTVIDPGTFNATLNQSGIFELTEMLGDSRLCQADFQDQVPIDTGFGLYQVLKDGNPSRMGDSFGQLSNLILLFSKEMCLCNSHLNIISLQYYDK